MMQKKTTAHTVLKLVNYALKGVSLSDKLLAFLIAGLGIMGYYRVRLRSWFSKLINNFAKEGFIELHFKYNDKKIRLFMRQGNLADYLMAGEFAKSMYPRHISMEIHYFDTKGKSLLSLLRQHGYTIEGGEDSTLPCTIISCYRN